MTMIPKAQEIYRHFKGNLYQIVTVAEHTETGEVLVIYQALYSSFKIYARPLAMFTEKVDKVKYPQATQEYRFELVTELGEDSDAMKHGTVETPGEKLCTGNFICVEKSSLIQDAAESTAEASQAAEDQQEDRADASAEEPQLDPLLLQFLDADTHEERLNILAALHHRITDDMITTMAIVCDVEVPEGDVETRYTELRDCLLTREKYEISRLN